MPCQDFSISRQGNGYAIAAVCDGHGASPYFRSGKGAKLAAEIGLSATEEFITRVSGDLLTSADDVNRQLSQLEKCIISRWGDAVYEDFLRYPYSDSEIAKIPSDWGFDDSVYSVYGTTMLLAAVVDKYWFGLQIGDGRIVELTANSEWREPVPWDDNCFLNATTSICDLSAADEFRHFYSEKLPAAIFLCTDGVSESYRDKRDFYGVFDSLSRTLVFEGIVHGKQKLQKELPEISAGSHGDDVSIACIYSPEKLNIHFKAAKLK
jgi:serine/threonine protein phosphatase PrpC